MADAPEQQQEAVEESRPKSKLPLIVIVFVVLLGIIGAVGFMIMGGGEDGEDLVTATPKVTPITIQFPQPFTGNLAPPDDQYIYTANVALEITPRSTSSESEAITEFGLETEGPKTKLPRIKYIIQNAISTKTRQEVTSMAGRDRLETEIQNNLNQYLEKAEVQKVLLTITVPP